MNKEKNKKHEKINTFSIYKMLFQFLDSKDKPWIWVGIVLSLFNAIFYVTGTSLSGIIVTKCFSDLKHFSEYLTKFILWTSFMGACFIAYALCRYFQNKVFIRLAYLCATKMRKVGMENLMDMPISYYDKQKAGNLISILINDINNISNSILMMFNETFNNLFNIILSVIAMACFSLVMTAIILPISIIFFSISWLMIKKAQPAYERTQNLFGDLNAYTEEMINNTKITQTFDRQNSANKSFKKITKNIYKTAFVGDFWTRLLVPWIVVSSNMMVLIMGVLAVTFNQHGISTHGFNATKYDAGFVIAYINILWGFTGTVQAFFEVIFSAQLGVASTKRIHKLLDLEVPKVIENPVVLNNIKGKIEFDHVWFRYNKDSESWQLKDATFYAKPGQTIAIVGPTGAGKTTIINLLSKFYEYEKGSIKIDGVELKQITKKNLRDLMAVVLQDSFMFNDTVLNNLNISNPDLTRNQILDATDLTSAHSFINKLKHGYDTIIDNNSGELSQGERQLLSITRAILGDKKVLILDEATSNVDSNTEQIIQKALNEKIMKNKTSIVIAHRLSTIKNANLILVVDSGQIIEKGDHEELMAMKGYYYNLYQAQFK